MLAMAPRAVEIKCTGSRLSSTSLGSTALKNSTGNAKISHFNVAASPIGNGLLSLQAHCKSAVALVNERRIEFVRAKNVRVIGHIDGNSKETKPQKQEATEICSAESVEQLLLWQQSRKIGPGFANLGNTCYLNSVLQCLTYTPCFAQLLLDKDEVAKTIISSLGNNSYKFNTKIGQNGFNLNGQNGYGFCSVRAMSKLLQLVHGKNTVRVLQPKELVMNVRHISKTFRIGRQEDSHEFFRLLLDSMQRSSLRKARIKNEHHSVASTTFVHRIFGGKLKNCLQCAKCGYISERFDDFLDLSLEVAYGVQSVDSALRHFTATETLDDRNAWKCSKCGQLSRAEKSLSIAECPNVLTIHLKRFDVVSGKITRHIKFPPSLDIATGMSKHCDDRRRGRTKYELHAVLVHAGFSTDCGHYYAFVKGPSGQWYEMNDDSVRWVQIDTVLQQKAYMLFYSRVLPLFEQRKAKETMQKTEKGQVGNEEGKAHVPVSEKVVLQPKELDRTQFLASLKTTLFPNATSIKKTLMTLIVKKSHVTQQASILDGNETVAMPRFRGRLGRVGQFDIKSWRFCPRLIMTQLVTELPEELTEIKAIAEAASVKTRVPFEPRHLLNVGVRKASLYGREVDKWMGETDMEATSGSSDAASQETTDKALAAKHDRVLNALKQEEWKHRNARRQDLWDESLDMGKVKKVAKRKAFVPNEGRANMFQMTLMRKTKDAKRQRFG